uniref:Tissue factor pathway inhibitor n=1 Tax=Magallana gigas TaxID=29159 RepID=K1QEK5_MAGGI
MAFIQLCLPKYRNVSCYSAINSCEILSSLTDSSTCNFWSITLLQNNSRIHQIFSFGFKHSKYLAVDHASYRVRMSVLFPQSLDRVVPTSVAFTTILFPVSASSSGMVVVKETETTSPLYKLVSRGVEEMAVFFHQSGNCQAFFPSWTYNPVTQRCQEFVYGGCGGNRNRFNSLIDCRRICVNGGGGGDITPGNGNQICILPEDSGPCMAAIPRWHYNARFRRCERFLYGGCQGNENNFESWGQCQRACGRRVG